jgi:glutamate synthase domain-containing protein 2/glutamate synthase domain-containing protein 1/glutamate synthase domain-containing protein 3
MRMGSLDSEKSSCGVGFVASRAGIRTHEQLQLGLYALRCVEHRGACAADERTGDGTGIMTDIPFEMFGYEPETIAVATLYLPVSLNQQRIALNVFEETFTFFGLSILAYRDVPIDESVLGTEARKSMPVIRQAFIQRPAHCRTHFSFDTLLYTAKQVTLTKERAAGIVNTFFFASLSSTTIIYKALTRAEDLERFYPDLCQPSYLTRFALFHRRFSTNTRTSWDKAQPFRMIAHNGEINTIAGNRSWGFSRERALGLVRNELLTREGISDTGSLNEMVEALMFRSSIQHVEDIAAILMPPADHQHPFYRFWSRAMEPWDGPAFVNFCDGQTLGARLDRNGFRPCRWDMTEDHFFLCSEAGAFPIDQTCVLAKGALSAGKGVQVDLSTGLIRFTDPAHTYEYNEARLDERLLKLDEIVHEVQESHLDKKPLFFYTDEELDRILSSMIDHGKEPIGSMGDTARLAVLSDQPRPFFDFFYQHFAQVTNPPLDYLRETMITDLKTYLGKRPNIFATKELIPPPAAIALDSPILSLAQFESICTLATTNASYRPFEMVELSMTYPRHHGAIGFRSALDALAQQAVKAVKEGATLLILTDKHANFEQLPIPSLWVLRAVVNALNQSGLRLQASTLVHTGEVRTTHQLAALISFGATAVCPYLALEIARTYTQARTADQSERNLLHAFEQGLLKIMSKAGISVVRSYHSSKMFTAIGLGPEIIETYFPGLASPVGGIGIKEWVERQQGHIAAFEALNKPDDRLKTYQFKEHTKGTMGERHSMTNAKSKLIHALVRDTGYEVDQPELYAAYLALNRKEAPINLRHLLDLRPAIQALPLTQVQSAEEIMRTFGSGAMSFGAISAEAQRDLFLAMKSIGGRSNSGEGGENPYYETEGLTASIKQLASGRFGVTAVYVVSGDEVQIKIAQGAKPGEGGQLMGIKVNPEIAKARYAKPGIDLISPPPMHDIYSIEDLKQLIYELKQVKPDLKVSVKLVSGMHVGTIAVGVAKAGADIVHIAGYDGGTGAAPLSAMKHAGLPWELGLLEAHQYLVENGLRNSVKLRTDGGLQTGEDIIMAAILGADEYDFGKLLLVSQGCVMARICEKNTCPTGIATHDPKFKTKYKGSPEAIVRMLQVIAEDVRSHLARIGVERLQELRGRRSLLQINEAHRELLASSKLDLSVFLQETEDHPQVVAGTEPVLRRIALGSIALGSLNAQLTKDAEECLRTGTAFSGTYPITTADRAVMATLSGVLARQRHQQHLARVKHLADASPERVPGAPMHFRFEGSAGQGFGVFLVEGLHVYLLGEANDSVGKSMSGGRLVIRPKDDVRFVPEENVILGNTALYGATGGILYARGKVGDRFAVRNSGAVAVVEGAGMHACEYMTQGCVLILGSVGANIGAGMSGGVIYVRDQTLPQINSTYVIAQSLEPADEIRLRDLVNDYYAETDSTTARALLANWEQEIRCLRKVVALAEGTPTRQAPPPSIDEPHEQAHAPKQKRHADYVK